MNICKVLIRQVNSGNPNQPNYHVEIEGQNQVEQMKDLQPKSEEQNKLKGRNKPGQCFAVIYTLFFSSLSAFFQNVGNKMQNTFKDLAKKAIVLMRNCTMESDGTNGTSAGNSLHPTFSLDTESDAHENISPEPLSTPVGSPTTTAGPNEKLVVVDA